MDKSWSNKLWLILVKLLVKTCVTMIKVIVKSLVVISYDIPPHASTSLEMKAISLCTYEPTAG